MFPLGGFLTYCILLMVLASTEVLVQGKLARLTKTVNNLARTLSILKKGSGVVSQTLTFLDERTLAMEEKLLRLKTLATDVQGGVSSLENKTQKEISQLKQSQNMMKQELSEIRESTTNALSEPVIRNVETEVNEIRQNETVLREELEQKVNNTVTNIKGLNSHKDAITEKLLKLKQKVTDTLEKLNIAKEKLPDLNKSSAVLKDELTELTNDLKKELNKHREESRILRQNSQEIKESIANTQSALNEFKKQTDAEMTELRQVIIVLKTELNELRQNGTAVQKQMKELVSSLQDGMTQLRQEHLILSDSMNNFSQNSGAELEELTGRVGSIKQEHNVLKENNNVSGAEITQIRLSDESLRYVVKRWADKIAIVEEELAVLRNRSYVLDSQLKGLLEKPPPTTTPLPLPETTKKFPGQSQCYRGMPSKRVRQVFVLWDDVRILCDTRTDGGGWIIIQRRTKGNVSFYRNWIDYKKGFGTPYTDFWIGNDVIYNLTSEGYNELRIDMSFEGRMYFAHYSHFSVADELSGYRLSVSGYSGTAGDSLEAHNGMKFSTVDRDNDKQSYFNCAQIYYGAWWYNMCHTSNLNGWWGKSNKAGVIWHNINSARSLSATEMKIRHV